MCEDIFVKVPQKLINFKLKRNPEDILKDSQLIITSLIIKIMKINVIFS